MPFGVRVFLSTVSAEFRSCRDALRRDLDRPNVTVKEQEDFIATGTEISTTWRCCRPLTA